MMTLFQIETRHDSIQDRMEEIGDLITSGTGNPEELLQEIAQLTAELHELRAKIAHHNELATALILCDCPGGPH